MKRLKRLLSLLVVSVMTLAIVVAPTMIAEAAIEYQDVSASHWAYYPIMEWSSEKNTVLKGYGDGSFGAENPIQSNELTLILERILGAVKTNWNESDNLTREQVAKVIAQTLGIDGIQTAERKFNDDSNIGEDYKPYVYALYERGYVIGVGDNNFDPKKSFTRAEITQMLYNSISKMADEDVSNEQLNEILVLRTNNLTVKNTSAKDIIIGAKDATLEDIALKGNLLIHGDKNSKVVLNNVAAEEIKITSPNDSVKLLSVNQVEIIADSKTKIKRIVIDKSVNGNVICSVPNANIINNSQTGKVLGVNGSVIAEPTENTMTNSNGNKTSTGSSGGGGGSSSKVELEDVALTSSIEGETVKLIATLNSGVAPITCEWTVTNVSTSTHTSITFIAVEGTTAQITFPTPSAGLSYKVALSAAGEQSGNTIEKEWMIYFASDGSVQISPLVGVEIIDANTSEDAHVVTLEADKTYHFRAVPEPEYITDVEYKWYVLPVNTLNTETDPYTGTKGLRSNEGIKMYCASITPTATERDLTWNSDGSYVMPVLLATYNGVSVSHHIHAYYRLTEVLLTNTDNGDGTCTFSTAFTTTLAKKNADTETGVPTIYCAWYMRKVGDQEWTLLQAEPTMVGAAAARQYKWTLPTEEGSYEIKVTAHSKVSVTGTADDYAYDAGKVEATFQVQVNDSID
jgi:hypothetical protein